MRTLAILFAAVSIGAFAETTPAPSKPTFSEAVTSLADSVNLFRTVWKKCPDARIGGEITSSFVDWAGRVLLDEAGDVRVDRLEALRALPYLDARRWADQLVRVNDARCSVFFPSYARRGILEKVTPKIPRLGAVEFRRSGDRVLLEGAVAKVAERATTLAKARATRTGEVLPARSYIVFQDGRAAQSFVETFRSPADAPNVFQSLAEAQGAAASAVLVSVDWLPGTRLAPPLPGMAAVAFGFSVMGQKVAGAPAKLVSGEEALAARMEDPFARNAATLVSDARKASSDADVGRFLNAAESLRFDDSEWAALFASLGNAALPLPAESFWKAVAGQTQVAPPLPGAEAEAALLPWLGKIEALDAAVLRTCLPSWLGTDPARFSPWAARMAALRPALLREEFFFRQKGSPKIVRLGWTALGDGKAAFLERAEVGAVETPVQWASIVEFAASDPDRRVRSAVLVLDHRLCMSGGRRGDCGLGDVVTAMIDDADPAVRHGALGRLWYRWTVQGAAPTGETVLTRLASRLLDESPTVRMEAQKFFKSNGPLSATPFASWLGTAPGRDFLRTVATKEPDDVQETRALIVAALSGARSMPEEAKALFPAAPVASGRQPDSETSSLDDAKELPPEPEYKTGKDEP